MTRRILLVAFSALALVLWTSNNSLAKDEKVTAHEGTVVSTGDGKLTMTNKDTKEEHSHAVPATATVTLDGKKAALADLKRGDHITVTVDAEKKVTKIEAKRT